MNNTTTQPDNEILELARVTCEELDPSYDTWLDELHVKDMADYEAQREPAEDGDDMTEYDDDQQEDDSDDDKYGFMREPREDNFRDDVDADANALASAGWGTDEDYGGDYFDGGDY
jgi:hypothetical protein